MKQNLKNWIVYLFLKYTYLQSVVLQEDCVYTGFIDTFQPAIFLQKT